MNKNGVELSLQTIAVLILIVIVLVVLIVAFKNQITNLFDQLGGFILE